MRSAHDLRLVVALCHDCHALLDGRKNIPESRREDMEELGRRRDAERVRYFEQNPSIVNELPGDPEFAAMVADQSSGAIQEIKREMRAIFEEGETERGNILARMAEHLANTYFSRRAGK